MNHLFPCPSCARHVRQSEATCPFCSVELQLAAAPAPALPRVRLSRAATFAFGASLVGAAALVACGGESEVDKPGSGGAGGSHAGSSPGGASASGAAGHSAGTFNGMGGNIAQPYGVPPFGGFAPAYGLPPDGGAGMGSAGGGGTAGTGGAGLSGNGGVANGGASGNAGSGGVANGGASGNAGSGGVANGGASGNAGNGGAASGGTGGAPGTVYGGPPGRQP